MCSRNQLEELLRQVVMYSKDLFGDRLRSVVLYGSYARGDYDEESDIDIAILADILHEEENAYHTQLVKMVGDIYEAVDCSAVLSPVVISSSFFEHWKDDLPFYRNVAQEGVRIVA